MGRPIGSVNRQKPFTDVLRVALLSGGGRRLRIIADKLIEKAEQGDLQAIKEVMAIIRDGSREPLIEHALICGPIPATT